MRVKKNRKVFLAIFLVLLLALAFRLYKAIPSKAAWYNPSWLYRKELVFNNSASSTNLTDFPVMVKLTSSNFTFSQAQSAGQDIRFTDSDGSTLLSYEFENYDSGSQTATIWVKIPQINATSSTDSIYMYWGNAGAADAQSADNTWNTNYKGVYHLNDNAANTTVTDSSGLTNSLTASANTSTQYANANGKISNGFLTMGTPQHIQVPSGVKSTVYPDVELDSSGNPVIAYTEGTNANLVVVHCNDQNCTGDDESVTSPDTSGSVGYYPSMKLDSSGFPVIAYYDVTNANLKIIHCDDVNCAGTETANTLDSTGDTGNFPKLLLDSSGKPVIAYQDNTSAAIQLIHCDDVNCAGVETITTVGSSGSNTYHGISMALDASNFPVITYYNGTTLDLMFVHCNDTLCAAETPAALVSHASADTGRYPDIILDGSGNPMIVFENYTDRDTFYIGCNDPDCLAETPQAIDISFADNPRIQKDGSGNPIIVYASNNIYQRVAFCSTPTCASTTQSYITIYNQYGSYQPDFVLAADGSMVIVNYSISKNGIYEVNFLNTKHKLDRAYDSDFDFGTSSFSISAWVKTKEINKTQQNHILSRYDTDQGFKLFLNYAGQPCFGIDDDATWGPDDSACTRPSDYYPNIDNGSASNPQQLAMVLDSNNYPVIAYYDATTLDLEFLHCNDLYCAGGDDTVVSLDTTGTVGQYPSIALDASGYPVISHLDATNSDIKVIHCGNANCTAGNLTGIANNNASTSTFTSLKLNSSGNPVVAFFDILGSVNDLKIATCTDTYCNTTPTTITLDSAGNVGAYASLELDASGFPVVSYQDATNFDVKLVHCGNADCTSGNATNIVDSTGQTGYYSDMQLDASGFPVIAYFYNNSFSLKIAHCNDVNCAGLNETINIADSDFDSGRNWVTLKLNNSGYPVILHTSAALFTQILTTCNDVNCTGDDETHNFLREDLHNLNNGALALDSSGNPVALVRNASLDLSLYRPTTATYTNTNTVDDGNWHHLVGVKNGTSSITLYVDGVAVATDSAIAATGTLTSNSASLNLAEEIATTMSLNNFGGYIDEVQIDNTARSSDWVRAQYLSESNNFINVKFTQYGAIANALGSFTNNTGSLKNNLVAYYKFDEGFGTTANNSGTAGSSHVGTIANATWTNIGKQGKAIIYNGTTSYTQLGTTDLDTYFEALDNWSISTWVNISGWANEGAIFSNRYADTEILRIYTTGTTGQIGLQSRDSGNSIINQTISGLTANTWYQITVSRTYNGTIDSYLNGVLKSSSADTRTGDFVSEAGSHEYFVGRTVTSADWVTWKYFTGMIDEVKIYNTALTAAEIKQDYNKKSAISFGSLSDTSSLSGGSVASNSASAQYCTPGAQDSCLPPITQWNFEEGSGTALNDTSGNTSAGTWSGTGNHWSAGKLGKAGLFNGSDDFVDLGTYTNLNGATAFTISFWLYKEEDGNFPTYDGVFGIGTGAQRTPWIYGNSGLQTLQAQFETTTGGIGDCNASTSTIPANSWSHISLRWTGTECQFFVNGIAIGTADSTTGTVLADTDGTNYLGRILGYDYWNGAIDNMKIYTYARTPSQIAWDYNQGKPNVHYKFDECSGTTLNDSSGNAKHATISIGVTGANASAGTCTTSGAWFDGATGKFNSSLDFDGTDDQASLAEPTGSYVFEQDFTAAIWAKTSGTSGTLFQKATSTGGTIFGLTNVGGNIYFSRYDGEFAPNAISTSLINTNNWVHIVGTKKDSILTLYINGKVESVITDDITGGGSGTNFTTYIGNSSAGTSFFTGLLDDASIYNYALTPSQIKTLYNNSSAIRFGP